ncbi:MAG: hexokinase [Spirochaetes bacterium]|nr:MAG: hexokinase [Spirochaetota bacterium]
MLPILFGILFGMNPDKKKTEQFLNQTDMHPERIKMTSTVDDMVDDMKRGLNGEPASMEMIPTFIEVDTKVQQDKKAVVLDAGGTNLRAALVSFNSEGMSVIEDFTKQPMPGTQGREVSREEFFDSLAALVEPLADRGEKIGFCFSYPTEIFPDKDGRLMHWTKEVLAPGVVGRKIGSDLRDALSERGVSKPPEVVILNDTVATVLTGKASQAGRDWGGFIGLILGTGTNTCYVESNASIGKIQGLDASRGQVINCESGSYTGRFRGKADEMLCSLTERPDFHQFEKMISGRYFGPLVTQSVLLAGESGLFSKEGFAAIKALGEISTKDADNYTHNPSGSGNALVAAMQSSGSDADARRLWFLIDALLERAAKLTAANLAAAVIKGQGGSGPLSPTCITIDGTTYYRYYRFQHRVESYLRPFLSARDNYYETVQVDDAPLIGAAVAALTN